MGTLRIMDKQHGDVRLSWGSAREEQEAAREAFDSHRRRGFRAYRVNVVGGKRTGDPIDSFDPEAGELLMVPPMAGG
jgi:hypothetical protein